MLGRRIRRDEYGFSLLEMVVAMGVIFISMTVLAATAMVGFKGAQTARQRETATALADQLVEQVRGLPFAAVKEGLKDSDGVASGTLDTNIASCAAGAYCYSGQAIVHQAALTYDSGCSSAAVPLYPLCPHKVTLGSSDGFPQGGTRALYVTSNGSTTNTVYRLTIVVTWTSGASTSSIQTQTLLSNPKSSAGTTATSSGTSTASFYGTANAGSGSVVITPNGSVYNSGIGITGLTTSYWGTSDSFTQRLYSLNAELAQGQVATVDGQATLTSAEKSIGGTVTSAPTTTNTTYSVADDDATTSTIGTSSSPTSLTQSGPSLTLGTSGSTPLLTENQYSQTTTTTSTTGIVTRRAASSNTSVNGSITITAPSGMAANDLLLAGLSYQGACMGTPTGWTLIRCDQNATGPTTSSIFWKWATSSDVSTGSLTFSTGGTSGTAGGIVAYTGADTTGSSPIDTSTGTSGTSTTATTPANFSVGASNARLVTFFAARGNTTITPTDPGTGNGGASSWAQNWSAKGGNSSKYYLTSAPALSTTAGSGTIGSGGTNSSSFSVAKTFKITLGTTVPNGTHTWPLTVSMSAADSGYEYYFYLERLNSSNVAQSTSGNSTTFTGTGTKSYTFSWDAGTWSTGDQLAVVWMHRKTSQGGSQVTGTMNTTSASYLDPTGTDFWAGGASAGGNKQPPGQGVQVSGWSASLSSSAPWVAQMVSLRPGTTTTTTTTNDYSTYGTETGTTVSTVSASVLPACGSPTQTDGKPCGYATQSYAFPSNVDSTFLATTVDFSNASSYSGLGTCRLYKFGVPTNSGTSYAYGRRQLTSGDGKVREDVKRYYGTHIFGQTCSGTGTPSGWSGYYVKYDAGTSACQAIAEAGVSASNPTTTTCGTIYVWNGSGYTSFSPPTSGTWTTSPSTVSFSNTVGGTTYQYDMSGTLSSGQTYTSTSTVSGTLREAKAVVGSPVVGTISYKLTDTTNNRILIDLTLTIDLGSLTSYAKYTPAA
jgi:type II secretory pathway pseudopilin PulG